MDGSGLKNTVGEFYLFAQQPGVLDFLFVGLRFDSADWDKTVSLSHPHPPLPHIHTHT